ncbi:hypothetical protein ACFYZ8_06125 [Streptomyces sp. NPDC001668]|uniref:hypothetical protein n=1 Tax=unclassified Streptomyces TaxID=2593676 RepID=UPI0033C6F43B
MADKVYPPLVMPAGVGRRKVTVRSDGIALDADVYRPTNLARDAAVPAVVLSHRDLPDDPAIIDETRQYLRDAQRLLAEKPTPQQFFDEITARHPDRLNIGPVWYGAHGLLGGPTPAATEGDPDQANE